MRPINIREIRLSLFKFIFQFSILLVFSLTCVFLFIRAMDAEYKLLKQQNDEIEKMISSRIEINQQFYLINKNFKEIGAYSNSLSDLAKKRILQTEIAKSSGVINNVIAKIESKNYRPSVDLYRKMNSDISAVSRLQDSLYTTKNLLESKRMQLNTCLKDNSLVERRISEVGIRIKR